VSALSRQRRGGCVAWTKRPETSRSSVAEAAFDDAAPQVARPRQGEIRPARAGRYEYDPATMTLARYADAAHSSETHTAPCLGARLRRTSAEHVAAPIFWRRDHAQIRRTTRSAPSSLLRFWASASSASPTNAHRPVLIKLGKRGRVVNVSAAKASTQRHHRARPPNRPLNGITEALCGGSDLSRESAPDKIIGNWRTALRRRRLSGHKRARSSVSWS